MPAPQFDDPFRWFDAWYSEALERVPTNPNAMTLATVDSVGRPSSRVVLLKSWDQEGFVFHTNRQSRKGREIRNNDHVALSFYWRDLDRQIRIEGTASRLSDEASDEYFATRARGSQIGAWASQQSEPRPDGEMEERLAEFEERFPDEVPRPPHWGGYVVSPRLIEFWEQGEFRIHDRWEWTRGEEAWNSRRLYP